MTGKHADGTCLGGGEIGRSKAERGCNNWRVSGMRLNSGYGAAGTEQVKLSRYVYRS